MHKTFSITLRPEIAERLEKLLAILNVSPGKLINEILSDPLARIFGGGDTELLQRYLQSFQYEDKHEVLPIITGYQAFISELNDRGDHNYHDTAAAARTPNGDWEVVFSSTHPDDADCARYR
jgi:hypothetical protein